MERLSRMSNWLLCAVVLAAIPPFVLLSFKAGSWTEDVANGELLVYTTPILGASLADLGNSSKLLATGRRQALLWGVTLIAVSVAFIAIQGGKAARFPVESAYPAALIIGGACLIFAGINTLAALDLPLNTSGRTEEKTQ